MTITLKSGQRVFIDRLDLPIWQTRSWWSNGKYVSGWSKELFGEFAYQNFGDK